MQNVRNYLLDSKIYFSIRKKLDVRNKITEEKWRFL